MPMNLAIPVGLAQTVDYDGRIRDLQQDEQMRIALKNQQEAKAKMFADDTDYTNAMNTFDNPKVKKFAQAKIREIGAFVNANPDYRINPSKMMQYKMLVHDLKDNPDLVRGIATDIEMQKYKDFVADPKNADTLKDPSFAAERQRYENYLQYGHPDGSAANGQMQAYTFMAPKKRVNWTDKAVAMAKGADMNGFGQDDGTKGFGKGNYYQYVADEDKSKAEGAMLLSDEGKAAKEEFDSSIELQKKYGTVENMMKQVMKPYYPSPKYQQGKFFADKNGKSGAGSGAPTEAVNKYSEMLMKAKSNPGQLYEIPKEISENFFNSNEGDLSNIETVGADGGVLSNEQGQPYTEKFSSGIIKATDKLFAKLDKNGNPSYYIKGKIKVPITRFMAEATETGKNAIDFSGLDNFGGVGPKDKFTIHNQREWWGGDYTHGYDVEEDKDGNTYVVMNANIPIQDNPTMAAKFNDILGGHAQGKGGDSYTSEKNENEEIYDVSTQKDYDSLPNGVLIRDSTGKVVRKGVF